MELSPENIRKQEFKNSLKGFDKEEVLTFLEKIANDFDELQNENDSLKKELETLNEQLAEYKKIEKNIKDTLSKSEESSKKSMDSAKKQINRMIQETQLKAHQILEKAKENANDVRNSLIQLREERTLIVAKLRAIINSQAQLLEMKVEEDAKEKDPAKPEKKISKVDIDPGDIADKL
jgi:cell division initiation protein